MTCLMGFCAWAAKGIFSAAAFIRFDSSTTAVHRGRSFSMPAESSAASEPYNKVAMYVDFFWRFWVSSGMLLGPVPFPLAVATYSLPPEAEGRNIIDIGIHS